MKHAFFPLSGVIMALLSAVPAHAKSQEQWPRWYVGLSGGVQFLEESDLKQATSGSLDYNSTGYVFTGSLGYMPNFGVSALNNFRIEGEVGYHLSGLDSATVSGTKSSLPGDAAMLSYMGNLLYDFRNGSSWTPYIGAGLGVATVRLEDNTAIGNTNDSDTTLAYQGMIGIAYAPENIPLTEWTLGYRYFVADGPSFAAAGGNVKLDNITAHSVELGGRFRF